ncbi:MAG: glycosyltransferase [Flavobacteriia bacterium]
MKVLHINTFDSGGAAKACIRLHEGLRAQGIDSHILFLHTNKTIDYLHGYLDIVGVSNWKKIKRRFFDSFKYRFRLKTTKDKIISSYTVIKDKRDKQLDLFSCPYSEYDITESPNYKEADIIHLHWIAGFVDLPTFFKKNKKPVIWTLHDMFPFTGCVHYQENYLGILQDGTPKMYRLSMEENEFQATITHLLKNVYENIDIKIVTPSNWLYKEAKNSLLLKSKSIQVIPNGFNTAIFKLPATFISKPRLVKILFVADNVLIERKGFTYFKGALERLFQKRQDIQVISVGSGLSPLLSQNNQIKFLGKIDSEKQMAEIYSDSDLYVIPSLTDNLPNTIVESLLCGTPVVGFPVGGINELIQSGINGILAESISIDALTRAIENALERYPSFNRKEIAAKAKMEFNQLTIAKKYVSIYTKSINNI